MANKELAQVYVHNIRKSFSRQHKIRASINLWSYENTPVNL